MPSERSTAYLLFRLWAAAEVPRRGRRDRGAAVPRDHARGAGRQGRRRAGHPRGALHLPELRAAQARRHGRALGAHHRPADPAGRDHRQALAGRGAAARARRRRSAPRCGWPGTTRRRPAPYVLEHAQEMDPAVADQHIGLYVNEFTADLGEDGYAAVRGLLTRAAAEGLVPPLGRGRAAICRRGCRRDVPERAGPAATRVPAQTSSWSATARSRPAILWPCALSG